MKPRNKIYALMIPICGMLFILTANAATPTPTPVIGGIPVDGVTLSSFLQAIVDNFVAFHRTFQDTVEGTLGGYFAVLAYILAWVFAVFYFIQQFIQGEWDAAQIGRFTGSIVVCLLLLVFCGDVDNDGHRGDIVRMPAVLGYQLSFGEDPLEPTGSYISRLVNAEREKFNTNYQAFVENKLMVKINDKDMPVKYPGMQGVITVAASFIGNPPKPGSPEEKEFLSQGFWIGLEFQVLNFFRSVIEIIDFFLLVLYAFAIMVCSIIAPFMCCVFVNRDFRKRFTYPFLWTVATVTIIFPTLSQVFRYFAYLSSNIALGTNGNPIYTYDPQTFTITANGDPTPMILVAVLAMIISIVLLVMSLMLSYSFAQGKLVESMSGLIANTFAGLSSVGIGAAVGIMATKMSSAAEKQVLEANERAQIVGGGFNQQGQLAAAEKSKQASLVSTEGGYLGATTSAKGERIADEQSLVGGFLTGSMGVQSQQITSKMQTQAGTATQLANLNQKEREELIRNDFNSAMTKRGITDDAEKERLLQESGLLNLKGDIIDNEIASYGFFGAVAGQFINGKTTEGWVTGGKRAIGSERSNEPYHTNVMPNLQMPDGSSFTFEDFVKDGVTPNTQSPLGNPMSGIVNPGIPNNPRFEGAAGSFNVSPDGTPLFKQNDGAWGKETLGAGGTIGAQGCAMTSMAMAASKISGKPINPEQMDKYLDTHNGYQGNALKWNVAADAAGLDASKKPWSMDTINKQLDAGRPVVVGADWKEGSKGGANGTDHWMALTGREGNTYFGNDPATGKQVAMQLHSGGGLAGGKYRTTGELVTFSGGSARPEGFAGGGGQAGQIMTLAAPGVPHNLPPTLLQPNNRAISNRANTLPVQNQDLVYYSAEQESSFVSTGNKAVDSYILGAARTHGVNPNLLKAQFTQESQLKSGAVSPKGASGVAQLMPDAAKEVGVIDRKDPAQSIYGGAKYMRYQADRMVTEGGVRDGAKLRSVSLAGYNSGFGNVKKAGFEVPQIKETQGYVGKITEAVGKAPNNTRSSADIKRELGTMSRPEAEAYGKVYSNLYGESKALEKNEMNRSGSAAITRQSYGEQRSVALANQSMQFQIADTQAQLGMRQVEQSYKSGAQAADTRFTTKGQVAEINRSTGYQTAGLQYEGAVNQAAFQYEGTKQSAKITKEAGLDALYQKNMANLVQTIGSSAAHQFSELFERASRGM